MKFGGIEMPVYQGWDADGRHIVRERFEVTGALDDGRVFEIAVDVDFVFDGASVPRWLWKVCGHPLSIPRVAAALAHDWLYAAQVCDRELADDIYRAICRQVGIGGFAAGVEYYALRWFGGGAWKEKTENDMKFARMRGRMYLEGERMEVAA